MRPLFPRYSNDGTKYANLFNQLYSGSLTPAYPSPDGVFQYYSTTPTGTKTTTSLLLYGTLLSYEDQLQFVSAFLDVGAMSVLANSYGLTCLDQVRP